MRSTRFLCFLFAAATAAGAGCATQAVLRPGPTAARLEHDLAAARASAAGVVITAEADAWTGIPRRLDQVEPLLMTIENNGPRPVRIRYEQFALEGPGDRLSALPPLEIEGRAIVHVPLTAAPGIGGAFTPATEYRGFWPIGPFSALYPDLDPWPGAFAYDPLWHSGYYARWPVELPTPDMIARALPEGVIEPGGRLRGFLYFEAIPPDTSQLMFRAAVMDAESDEQLGLIEIPFQVAWR